MHKSWKIRNNVKKYKIYTRLVEFTFKHIISKSTQKSVKHERKVSSRRCCPSMLHDHFIDLPPILEKKEKKISINLKNIIYIYIYTTQWQQYTSSLILKKTHTKQYYLKTVQLNKEKSNSNLKNTKKLPES